MLLTQMLCVIKAFGAAQNHVTVFTAIKSKLDDINDS